MTEHYMVSGVKKESQRRQTKVTPEKQSDHKSE